MSTVKTYRGFEVPEGAVAFSAAENYLHAIFYARRDGKLVFTLAGETAPHLWEESLTLRENVEWFPTDAADPVVTPRIAAHEFLERGISHMRDRAVQRDSEAGERSMARAVAAFNAQEGTNLTEAQGWRFMIQLKYARAVNGVFVADDYEDMAAYAGLAGEAAQ